MKSKYFREYFCSFSSKSYYFYILGVSHLKRQLVFKFYFTVTPCFIIIHSSFVYVLACILLARNTILLCVLFVLFSRLTSQMVLFIPSTIVFSFFKDAVSMLPLCEIHSSYLPLSPLPTHKRNFLTSWSKLKTIKYITDMLITVWERSIVLTCDGVASI